MNQEEFDKLCTKLENRYALLPMKWFWRIAVVGILITVFRIIAS